MEVVKTEILHEEEISYMGRKYAFLKNTDLSNQEFKDWQYVDDHDLGYRDVKSLNIIFIGQTGYGKSSLINKLIGLELFEKSDYESCTKTLQSAVFFLHHKKKHEKLAYHLSFVDLPGIGESNESDEKYLQWYRDYIEEASIVVYLFRADKRDHAQDEFFSIMYLKKQKAVD